MTRDTLLALAARVEAAKGADRALDAEIATALGWTEVHGSVLAPQFRGGRPPGVTDWWGHVPAYTASLDAAASLVPTKLPRNLRPGQWWWMMEAWAGNCRASVNYENGDAGIIEESATAATPALALTAAALRARAEEAVDA